MRLCVFLLSAILLGHPAAAHATEPAASKPLEIGVVPYMSARVLVNSYEPMRQYLEQVLGRPVKIYTASSFKQFLLSAQHGDYDLAISPAHFARILQKDDRYSPLVRYAKGGRGLVMVAPEGPVKSLADLKGRVLAVPFQLSLASIVCMTSLQENGLRAGVDFSVLEVPSFESAILAVQNGDADAAVSAPGAITQLNKKLQDVVHPVLDTGEYINLIYLTHPRLDRDYAQLLHNTFRKFGKSPEGKRFFADTGFGEFLEVSSKEMNSLDKYLPETRRLLQLTQ